MRATEVEQLVEREISSHGCEAADWTLGRPLPEARVAAEIAEPRSSFVPVRRAEIVRRYTAGQTNAEPPITTIGWIVAVASDGPTVFLDEEEDEFGLALEDREGILSTIGVHGDPVGTFMAR